MAARATPHTSKKQHYELNHETHASKHFSTSFAVRGSSIRPIQFTPPFFGFWYWSCCCYPFGFRTTASYVGTNQSLPAGPTSTASGEGWPLANQISASITISCAGTGTDNGSFFGTASAAGETNWTLAKEAALGPRISGCTYPRLRDLVAAAAAGKANVAAPLRRTLPGVIVGI